MSSDIGIRSVFRALLRHFPRALMQTFRLNRSLSNVGNFEPGRRELFFLSTVYTAHEGALKKSLLLLAFIVGGVLCGYSD